ncbi:MAG: sugar ABC transporter permease [Oscillospiraceae bacterium]|jgi:multiple sugar transport system permease protein|nr:sugar ABC transporter permease [Oscillospiraceae bacterium]
MQTTLAIRRLVRRRGARQGAGQLRRNEALTGMAFIAPSLAGCLVFVFVPFLDALRRSVTNGFTGGFAGLTYYIEIFHNQSFLTAVANTGRFIALCVPALVALSLGLALALDESVPGHGALRAAFLLPMAVPVACVALLWQLLFHQNGLVNAIPRLLSLPSIDWTRGGWALACLIISYVWKNVGYNMVLFIAGLGGISATLYEAAAVDGASPARRFISITLPCLKPTVFTVTVLSLLGAFKSYREAYLVAGSYPPGSVYLLQHTLNNWFAKLEIERLSAAAVVTAAVILALVALLNRAWASDAGL